MATQIQFDSYDLQDANIVSSRGQHTQYPDRQIDILRKSRDNDFVMLGNYFILKRIIVEGTIKETTADLLRDKIDDMKKNLTGQDKNLDIDYGSGTRRYLATVESLDIDEQYYNKTFVKYRVVFLCHAFGRGTTEITRSLTNITGATTDSEATIDGTAVNLPIVRITVNSETDMRLIRFTNTTTDEFIEVETTYSAGDVLNINCQDKEVLLNDNSIDFIGIFPTFIAGVNGWKVEVSDTGAFQLTVEIIYTPNYM